MVTSDATRNSPSGAVGKVVEVVVGALAVVVVVALVLAACGWLAPPRHAVAIKTRLRPTITTFRTAQRVARAQNAQWAVLGIQSWPVEPIFPP